MKNNNFVLLLKRISRFQYLLIFSSLYFFSGCMMAGMHLIKDTSVRTNENNPDSKQTKIYELIDQAIADLSVETFPDIKFIGVGAFKSNSSEIDLENVRQKIIDALVTKTNFNVISRGHLDELLKEQSLSLSGLIDSSGNERTGKLKGLDGLLAGYLSIENDKVELSMNFIKTNNGQVIWTYN